MEQLLAQIKVKRTIQMFTWNIIIIASFALILGLLGTVMSIRMFLVRAQFQPLPTDGLFSFFNPGLYLFPSVYHIAMSILLILASVYVLRYNERWRKILLAALIIEVLFLVITPVLNISKIPNLDTALGTWGNAKTRLVIWSVIISYCLAFFFAIAAMKFSRGSVKQLFK